MCSSDLQKVLYADRGAGTRQRVHDHYLKGTVWCARCKRRLILRPSTSKTGNIYFYYICRGVQEHDCDLPALPVAKVEHAITNHYTNVAIPAQHRTRLETLAAQACADAHKTITKLHTRLRKQLAELDRQEDRYLDLLGDPDWPQAKLKSRLRNIRDSKRRITQQLEQTTDSLDAGRAILATALDLLDRPRDLYDTATDHARKLLNKAIFTRLYLDTNDPGHHPAVTTNNLNEPFASLIHATRTTNPTQEPKSTEKAPHGTTTRLSGLLASALTGQSASKAAMVELRGIEPLTFSMRKTGTGVDQGCFRTSWGIGGRIGAVLVGVVAVLLCCTAARLAVAVGPAWERRSRLARGPVLVLAESL